MIYCHFFPRVTEFPEQLFFFRNLIAFFDWAIAGIECLGEEIIITKSVLQKNTSN